MRKKYLLIIITFLVLMLPNGCSNSSADHEERTADRVTTETKTSVADPKREFQQLELDTSYQFDLDGDGKEDSFTCTRDGEEGEAAFIINQHSFPVFVARGLAGIYYYSYSKEDTYILYTYGQYGGNTTVVCRFTGDDLEEVADLNVLDRNNVLDASGKEINLETSHYHPNHFMGINEVSSDVPSIQFKATYILDPRKHTFELEDGICDALDDYELTYTGEDYTLSDSYTDGNQDGFTLSKGDKVRLSHMFYQQNPAEEEPDLILYGLTKDGKTGWLKKEFEDGVRFDY